MLKLQNLIWVFLVALYAPILWILYQSRWQVIDYTHAYFILPVTLWMVWRKRRDLIRLAGMPHPPARFLFPGLDLGLMALILGVLMFVFGWRKDFLFVSTLSLIPVLFGLITFLYGAPVAKAIRFPILYLLLMVPPPLGLLDAITLPMRYGASFAAYIVLKSFYLPFTRDGLLLSVEGQQLFMGPACSGFRSLITLFSLGLVYAYLNKGTLAKKLMLLAAIIPLALIGNLVRVIILCLMAYYFGQEAAQGFFHDFSGLVVFVIVFLGLLWLEVVLRNRMAGPDDE